MAATNINRVIITGNLTKDPELRSLQSGTAVCKLRVAVNSRRKDQSGEWVDKPNYFDVTVWGAQGENCARFLAKARPVAIDGRLEWREWDAKDGTKRQSVDIVADTVQFLGSRGDNGGGGQQSSDQGFATTSDVPATRTSPTRTRSAPTPAAAVATTTFRSERERRRVDKRRHGGVPMIHRRMKQLSNQSAVR